MMKVAVIFPAAGLGRRFQTTAGGGDAEATPGPSKIETDLAGRPVFLRAIEAFHGRPQVGQLLLAVPPDTMEEFKFKWGDRTGFLGVRLVAGGKRERWETVMNALKHVDASCTHVAIHDAARPLVSAGLIDRVFEAAERFDAVIPASPVAGTLKRALAHEEDNRSDADPLAAILGDAGASRSEVRRVTETVDRNDLFEVQTPQMFERSLIDRAYAALADGTIDPANVTDDAMLVEQLGQTVRLVEGEAMNLKITRPEDVSLAAAILSLRKDKDAALMARKRLFGDEDDE